MREIVEFRLAEEDAVRLLHKDEGKQLICPIYGPTVRKLQLDRDSERFRELFQFEQKERAAGRILFTSWQIRRRYSKAELSKAEYFQPVLYVVPHYSFEYGTEFNEQHVCPECGAGKKVATPLYLNLSKLPSSKDMFRTLDGQIVVSERMADAIREHGIQGCRLSPVCHGTTVNEEGASMRMERVPSGRALLEKARDAGIPDQFSPGFHEWINSPEQAELVKQAHQEYYEAYYKRPYRGSNKYFHLEAEEATVRFASETETGISIFDVDLQDRFRCSRRKVSGHYVGATILSELYFDSRTWDSGDIALTGDWLRTYSGPLVLFNRRFYDMVVSCRLKGFNIEIAHGI